MYAIISWDQGKYLEKYSIGRWWEFLINKISVMYQHHLLSSSSRPAHTEQRLHLRLFINTKAIDNHQVPTLWQRNWIAQEKHLATTTSSRVSNRSLSVRNTEARQFDKIVLVTSNSTPVLRRVSLATCAESKGMPNQRNFYIITSHPYHPHTNLPVLLLNFHQTQQNRI